LGTRRGWRALRLKSEGVGFRAAVISLWGVIGGMIPWEVGGEATAAASWARSAAKEERVEKWEGREGHWR
jgi:hypothetical protein